MAKIELSGFRDVDESTMALVNKNISNHLRRLNEITEKLELLHITLKPIHIKEKSEKYNAQAKLIDKGKVYAAEHTDRNLLEVIDRVLIKLCNEIEK